MKVQKWNESENRCVVYWVKICGKEDATKLSNCSIVTPHPETVFCDAAMIHTVYENWENLP